MKFTKQLRLLILSLAITSIALPAAALAGKQCCSKRACCMSKGGMVYNQYTGKYYRVMGGGTMVYRGVDCHYVPVASKSRVSVMCQTTPGWWWNTTWMAPSQKCWYVR